MDRERAETYLRLLAEAELRRAIEMPTGGSPGRWNPARLALAAQALTAVCAVDADVADDIQADVGLAVASRRRPPVGHPGRRRARPAPRRASWRVVPVGRVIRIRGDDGLVRPMLLMAYAQWAGGARLTVVGWPVGRVTFTAADDRGVSYQVTWHGGHVACELLLKPAPPPQIRWLDLATAGEPATRIDLDPEIPAPDATVARNAHSPGELLLDVVAARILTSVAPVSQDNPGQLAAARADLRAFIGDSPGRIVAALNAAGALPLDSPVPGQLAGLCARLGINGHGITAAPAGDLPERWHSMLIPRSREPPPPAPGILAATVAELPELDGAEIAIAGLHHDERGTILHLLATGVTLEDDWLYARGVRPLPTLWIRDSNDRWHTTHLAALSPWGDSGASPWTDPPVVMLWLRVVPPLDRGTSWIEISATGRSAQVRVTLPLRAPGR